MILKSFIAAGALLAFAAGPAFAHAKLESSVPRAGSTVAGAPPALRLAFNEPLEAPFSKIGLSGASGPVALPKAQVDKADPKVLAVPLPALAPGQYKVQWSTVTRDGHKVRGEFDFKVGK
jgi:methionine-rich copper-binding protein CopC